MFYVICFFSTNGDATVTSCPKKNILIIKLQPLSKQPSVLLKNEAHVRPSCRNAENSNIFTGKPYLLSLRRTLWPLFIDGPQQSTTQSPRVSGTHLINLRRMKG